LYDAQAKTSSGYDAVIANECNYDAATALAGAERSSAAPGATGCSSQRARFVAPNSGTNIGGLVDELGEAGARPHVPADYSTVANPRNLGASVRPTVRQVREMKELNRAQNGGVLRDDVTGDVMVDSAKSTSGVTPPLNEAQVDHIIPIDKGGTRASSNLQLLTRRHNRWKSNR
jgi:filamentous hemagglutinin